MSDRHPALQRLVDERVDPSAGLDVLVDELRRRGFAGSRSEAQLLVVAYRAIPEAWPPEIDPRLTMSRSEASRVLGRSVQRVDQLRRDGRITGRQRADGSIALNPDSVRDYASSPSYGRRASNSDLPRHDDGRYAPRGMTP